MVEPYFKDMIRKKNKSPVCLFVYNKHHLINRVLLSLSKCDNFKYHKVFIFSDISSNNLENIKVKLVRQKILKFKKKNKNVYIILREKKYGLKDNIIFGVSDVIKKYKKVIVVEDDLIFSKDFLNYMQKNLDFYKNHKKIFSISGYSPSIIRKNSKSYNHQNFFSYTPSSWGWATWVDRWVKFKPLIKLNNRNISKIKKVFKLTSVANYFSFKDINLKKRDLWAANFVYTSLVCKSLNSYPLVSKISNIGFDGTGQGGISKKFSERLIYKKNNIFSLNSKIKLNKNFDMLLLKYFDQNYFFRLLKYFIPLPLKDFFKYIYKIFYKNLK